MENQTWTVKQVADYLKVHPDTIYTMVKELIVELNEMEMAAANFRRHLYEAYLINPKQVRDETLTRIKAKGWVEV